MHNKQSFTKEQKKTIAWGIGFVVLAVTLTLGYVIAGPMLRFITEPELFRQWVEQHGIVGQIVYVLCMILQVIVALIPGEPLELVAGYAFGALQGTLLCLGAATVGSVLVFWMVRRYGIRLVEIFYSPDKLKNIRFLKSSPQRTLLYTIVFILPGTPKDLLCYFAGLTDMKFSHFLLICSLGRIPSIITSTLGGNALGTAQYFNAIVVLVIAVGISAAGLLVYRYICTRQNKQA